MVQFNDGDLNVFIDPFESGRFLSKADCIRMVSNAPEDPRRSFLPACTAGVRSRCECSRT
jgi:hypothetical protein